MIAERHTLFFSFLVIAWFPGFVNHRDGYQNEAWSYCSAGGASCCPFVC